MKLGLAGASGPWGTDVPVFMWSVSLYMSVLVFSSWRVEIVYFYFIPGDSINIY